MLKICASISLCLALAAGSASGQGYVPGSSPQAQAGMSVPTGGMFESQTFLNMANRAFDPSSDSMDFENGSFAWKGRTFNLTSQRAFRARFERFLLAFASARFWRFVLYVFSRALRVLLRAFCTLDCALSARFLRFLSRLFSCALSGVPFAR